MKRYYCPVNNVTFFIKDDYLGYEDNLGYVTDFMSVEYLRKNKNIHPSIIKAFRSLIQQDIINFKGEL